VFSIEDEELLFSWLGRMVLLNCTGDPRRTLAALFGTTSVTASVDLPLHLLRLAERVKGDRDLALHWIEMHTLYPYYRPFNPRTHETALRVMLQGGGGGLRMAMGHTANGFGNSPRLRYCPRCVERDRNKPGFAFWRRAHHLPGVTVCPEHMEVLVSAEGNERRWRKQFVLPPLEIFDSRTPVHRPSFTFAQISAELLSLSLAPLSPQRVASTYLHAMAARGLTQGRAGGQRPLLPELAAAVRHYYADFVAFEHAQRLRRTANTPLQWCHQLVIRPDRASHPICHLLLIGFLFGSVRNFVEAYEACGDDSDQESRRRPPAVRNLCRDELKWRRETWVDLLRRLGGAKAARAERPDVYAALYRCDREWLLAQNKSHRAPQLLRPIRVQWTARDADYCSRAPVVAKDLLDSSPRMRITASRLRRAFGEALVTRNMNLLPQFTALIEQLAETADQYHRRKIETAMSEILDSGRPLTWSEVQRSAGLRAWTPELRKHAQACAHSLRICSSPRSSPS
jgi:hypothetical protein